MSKKFLVSIDHNKLESLGFTLQNLASAPGTPATGQLYHNTVDKYTYKYDGSQWVTFIQSTGGTMTGILQTAAGTASVAGGLKLTSGTLKTSPIAGDSGSIEFNGSSLSFINSSGVRQTLGVSGSGIATATLTAPAAGFTITPSGTGTDPIYTFALTDDLGALEALATTGIVRRTGASTWSAGTAVALATEVSGTLPVANGGTGLTTGTSGGILAYTAAGVLASSSLLSAGTLVLGGGAGVAPSTPLGNGTTGQLLTAATGAAPTWSNVSAIVTTAAVNAALATSVGTLTVGTWNATTISANYGGTGLSVYAVGDLLQASSTSALARLPAVATGNVLLSGGVGTVSAWGKVDLTTHISGILPVANGGTGVTSSTGSGSNVLSASPALTGVPTAPTAASGTNTTQIATTAYVRTEIDIAVNQGLDVKPSVRAKTTANVATLAGGAPNTIDGVTLVANNRVLVTEQSTGSENGIYVVQTLGSGANGTWVRSADTDTSAKVTANMFTFVEEGTVAGDSGWVLTTNNPITLNTTALVFTQFNGAGSITAGAGLTKTGNTLDVGAGTGITVNTDDIAINTAVVVRKYAQTIGDNSSTSIAVTHSLNSQDVTVSIRDASTNLAVETDWTATSTSVCTFTFAVAPTTSQYRVVIHA
jgi:hypothetical protein